MSSLWSLDYIDIVDRKSQRQNPSYQRHISKLALDDIYIYIHIYGSIPRYVIPMTLEMVLDSSLLNTQQYKVRIKGIVKQSRERSSALPFSSVL